MTSTSKLDNQQFRQLVDAHKDQVLNTCFGFLQNREDAEDACQDVFIEVFNSMEKFREESQLSTWVYRIAVTKSLDLIRKKNRKKRFGHLKRVFGADNSVDYLPDKHSQTPEQSITEAERSRILQEAINKLSESQKVAITLSKIDGFSNKEIAEIMVISLSSVESLIHRAKKNLYSKLQSYFEKNI